jgi:outer membrane lipoprotein-sorting protein
MNADSPMAPLAHIEPAPEATARALGRVRAALLARPARWAPSLRVPLAAAALVLLGLTGLVSFRTPTALAFPQVADRLGKTRSITCVETVKEPGQPERTTRLLMLDNGLLRVEEPGGNYSIVDRKSKTVLLVRPAQKEAVLMEGVAPNLAPDLYDLVRHAPKKAVRPLPARTIDGKKADGFVIELGEGEDKIEATVWVDPATRLPLRFDYEHKDDQGGKASATITNLVYDAPLDEKLFTLKPPERYAVTRHGVAKLRPPPDDKALAAPELKVGVGLGPVRFGMTAKQVTQLLGEPDKIEARGTTYAYYSRGYGLVVSPQRGLRHIHCFSQVSFVIKVNDFRGKTTEGIGMGANLADIVKAHGKADEVEMNGPATAYVRYPRKGLSFTLFNDRVIEIHLTAPPP